MPGWMTETRAVAALIVVAALVFIIGSFAIPIGSLLAPGPGLVPLFLGCATLVAMIASLIFPEGPAPAVEIEPDAAPAEPVPAGPEPWLPRVPVILAMLGLLLLGFERIGFVISVFVANLVLLYFLERRSLFASLTVSLLLSAGLFILFDRVLHVTLPHGLLEF